MERPKSKPPMIERFQTERHRLEQNLEGLSRAGRGGSWSDDSNSLTGIRPVTCIHWWARCSFYSRPAFSYTIIPSPAAD
jgi:hypothetical protein